MAGLITPDWHTVTADFTSLTGKRGRAWVRFSFSERSHHFPPVVNALNLLLYVSQESTTQAGPPSLRLFFR